MHLAFELSGEHETLPRSEVFACFRALRISYAEHFCAEGILVLDARLSPEALGTIAKRLAMTHRIHEIKGMSTPEEGELLELIETIDMDNSMNPEHTFAVRITGKSSSGLERKAGEIIKRKGYSVNLTDPSKTFTLLFTKQTCFFCLLLYTADKKQFGVRRPHLRPFFSPGVIMPKFARALVNLSGVKENELLLDPFCGTGGILIEAGLIGAKIIGIDVQEKMVRGAEENLRYYGLNGTLIVGDAANMALRDSSVDAIVTDMPYGRSSLISGSGCLIAESRSLFLEGLYQSALDVAHRVLKQRGKAVIVSNSLSLYSRYPEHKFRVLEKHTYRVHKSLTRYIIVLEKR